MIINDILITGIQPQRIFGPKTQTMKTAKIFLDEKEYNEIKLAQKQIKEFTETQDFVYHFVPFVVEGTERMHQVFIPKTVKEWKDEEVEKRNNLLEKNETHVANIGSMYNIIFWMRTGLIAMGGIIGILIYILLS